MTTILGMIRKFESIKLRAQVPIIIEETKDVLISLNQEQLLKGVDSNGETLLPYRNQNYALYKNSLNPLAGMGTPDLKLSGQFFKEWVVKVSNSEMEFDSNDSKTPNLVKKYGDTVFGLSEESRKTYTFGAFYDGVRKHIEEKTGLKFG